LLSPSPRRPISAPSRSARPRADRPATRAAAAGDIVLGSECAGVVVAVGAGVNDLRAGDAVVALGRGCLARYATVPARTAVRMPETLDPVEAVTVPAALSTADYALSDLGRLRAGESILIHAAAGGSAWPRCSSRAGWVPRSTPPPAARPSDRF